MNKIYLYPYRIGSKSVRLLSQELNCKVIKRENSRYKQRLNKTVVNWGSFDCPYDSLNGATFVAVMRDKLKTFELFSHKDYLRPPEPRIPEYTTDLEVAKSWILQEKTVLVRKSLTGQGGSGIIVASTIEEIEEAPLYVRYIRKDSEYRVHIFNGEVIDVQRKIRNPQSQPSNWKIRSHSNGFIFIRNGFQVPEDVIEQAKRALSISGLVFGAVDVIYKEKKNEAYVLEVNTAPGLEGSSVIKYADAIRKYVNEMYQP